MIFTIYLLLISLYLAIYLYRKGQNEKFRNKRILPGLPSLPFIGSLLHMAKYQGKNKEFLNEMSRKFGSIFGIQFGSQYIAFTDDYDIMKYILNAEEWIDRVNMEHPMWFERSFNKPIGILTGSRDEWKETRKFTVRSLRDFGFGREGMESRISFEFDEFLKHKFESMRNVSLDGTIFVDRLFQIPVLNILWTMLAGHRFEYNDPKLATILKLAAKMNKALKLGLSTRFAYPWMRHIPHLTDQEILISTHIEIQNLIKEIMFSKRSDKIELMEKEPEDVIDVYLQEIENRRLNPLKDPKNNKYFSDEDLITVGVDLFITGSDSTSAALEFALLYMIVYPEVQQKVQNEIDQVIGSDRSPCLVDKSKMQYTEACTLEVLRFSSSFPMALRTARNDTELAGFHIPKGTIVGLNLEGMHHSKKIWSDPEQFRPERFLDSKGQIINSDKIFPFGTGKRICLGEVLARATFFKFFVSILQKYKVSKSPYHAEPTIEPISGFGQFPKPFHILIKNRQ